MGRRSGAAVTEDLQDRRPGTGTGTDDSVQRMTRPLPLATAASASALMPAHRLALCEADRQEVKRLVAAIVPAAQVWVFGSRATGRARPYSDLDLLIDCPQPLGWDQLAALADAFEQSLLPFRVDVVEARALAPAFRARVWPERIPL